MDVGVDLGGGDIRMAQHGLDGSKVRAVLEQVGGEGVAQDVGADGASGDPGFHGIFLEQTPQLLAGQGFAKSTDKQSVSPGLETWTELEPGANPVLGTLAEGD